MKRVLIVLSLLLFAAGICTAQPRVACIYSKFMNYGFKADSTQVLASIGWTEDLYENIQLKDLMGKLSDYDMVIMNGLFNYENSQDLTLYGKDFREYIKKGGCLVITDANYPPQTQWLYSIDPNLIWNVSSRLSKAEGQTLPWANSSHPLLANEGKPNGAWSYPDRTSPYMTVLYKYANGAPAASVLEIGEGAVVVSSMYHQTGWPTAGFLQNLAKWAKDPERLTKVRERNASVQDRTTTVPNLNIPIVSTLPIVDGKINSGEWESAAVLPAFYDTYGRENKTRPTLCKISRTKDDIVILFECTDNSIDKLTKDVINRDGRTWEDDSVEVFLDPTGTGNSYYQFAVNCSGALYDAKDWDSSWDTYWEAKTSVGNNVWTAEMRIPLAFLGKDAINSKDTWAAHFNRFTGSGSGAELSSYSPTFAYAALSGMSVSENSPYAQPIRVDLPQRWYMGTNNVDITISKEANTSQNATLQLIDCITGSMLWGKSLPTTDKPAVQMHCNVDLKNSDIREMQFVLSDTPEKHRILASSAVIRPQAAPALSLSVAVPVVMGTIQSKDPIKKLVVDGIIGINSTEKLSLVSQGVDANGKVKSNASCRVYSRQNLRFAVDLSKLAVGKYKFTLKLLQNKQVIASQVIPIIIAAPAATEVSFDDKRVCYVNGKPFFPIGLYHVSPAAINAINTKSRAKGLPELDLFAVIKQLRDLGFNTIHHTWGMPDKKYLDCTQSLGMWVVPEVAAPTKEQVELANQYTNVLMWYGSDEPSGETLNIIKRARIKTAELDPHRPVSAAVNSPDLYKAALGGFDFVMMDPYLIRNAPLAGIADCVKKGLDAGNGLKPVWLVPQAFTCDSGWEEPTPEEIKCEAYIGLVNGATGLIWYAFWTPENWSDSPVGRGYWVLSDTKLWNAFRSLNAEVIKLAPIVLTGQNLGPVKCTSPAVHTCLWKYKGKSFLMAVNTLYTPVNCTLNGFGKQAEVMFENKKVVTEKGILNESFKPLEVHVYDF